MSADSPPTNSYWKSNFEAVDEMENGDFSVELVDGDLVAMVHKKYVVILKSDFEKLLKRYFEKSTNGQ